MVVLILDSRGLRSEIVDVLFLLECWSFGSNHPTCTSEWFASSPLCATLCLSWSFGFCTSQQLLYWGSCACVQVLVLVSWFKSRLALVSWLKSRLVLVSRLKSRYWYLSADSNPGTGTCQLVQIQAGTGAAAEAVRPALHVTAQGSQARSPGPPEAFSYASEIFFSNSVIFCRDIAENQ